MPHVHIPSHYFSVLAVACGKCPRALLAESHRVSACACLLVLDRCSSSEVPLQRNLAQGCIVRLMGSVSGLLISTALAAPTLLAHQNVQNLCERGGNGACLPNGVPLGAMQLLPAHAF